MAQATPGRPFLNTMVSGPLHGPRVLDQQGTFQMKKEYNGDEVDLSRPGLKSEVSVRRSLLKERRVVEFPL
ncbi:hypothetical protein ACOMHN_009131 [Nucella lapillus]